MRQIRRFQDLTIGDSYMFSAVMMENDNCRQLLERVLEMPISRVEVIKEKSIIYHPECKGVRLDVCEGREEYPLGCRNAVTETGCASEEEQILSQSDGDEVETIFLSTRGKNPDEVSEELVSFFEFVKPGKGEAVYDVAGFDRRC